MKYLVLLPILLSIASFGQVNKADATQQVQTWIDDHAEGLELGINSTENAFKILCPLGVKCDENYDYRSFTYEKDDHRMMLSFAPELALGITLEGLNKHFKYFSPGRLSFPQSEGWHLVSYSMLNPIRSNVKFTNYEHGAVTFETTFTYKGFTLEDHSTTKCKEAYQMADSSIPEGCTVQFKDHLKVRLTVTAPIENKRVLDRTNESW